MKTFDLLIPQPELGKTAKELRESKGLSVIEFADTIGVTRQTIYNFENGNRQSMEVLQAYLKLNEVGNICD